MSIQLSIIIPAHNNEKTITKTLDSILISTCTNFEVIIINNGSSDKTLEVVKNYQKNDSRILCIDSTEVGVSNARNKGLEYANGEWILFVDADDQLLHNAMNVFNSCMFSKSDLVLFNYSVNNKIIKPYGKYKNYDELFAKMLNNPTKCMTVWNKLFHTNVIRNHGLKFNTDLKYSEDSEFLIRYMKLVKKIQLVDKVTYKYNLTVNSTVRKYNSDSIYEYIKAVKIIRKELPISQFQQSTNNFILMQMNLIMVHNIFSIDNKEKFITKLHHLKRISEIGVFKDAIHSVGINKISEPRFLPILLIKFNFNFGAGIIYFLRVWQNSR